MTYQIRTGMPPERTKGYTALICESLSDLAQYLDDNEKAGSLIHSDWGLRDVARASLHTGDSALVQRAEKLLTKMEAPEIMGQSNRSELVSSVSGCFADVPAYLSGAPNSMRLKRRRIELKPLRIVVDVTSSANVNDDTLERRGIATLALLRRLETAGYSVELWLVEAPNSAPGFTFVRMETGPMDLARSCWALASQQFARECAFSACATVAKGRDGAWPWFNSRWHGFPKAQQQTFAMALECEPESILHIPALYNSVEAQPFTTDAGAVKWLNDQYAAAIARTEESN